MIIATDPHESSELTTPLEVVIQSSKNRLILPRWFFSCGKLSQKKFKKVMDFFKRLWYY